jgi:type II secretory pathway component PulJ
MRRQTGLTLLDLLLAMSLLIVVLTTIYMVFANHERSVEAAAESRDSYGQARMILDRMIRDISGTWLPAVGALNEETVLFSGQEDRVDFITTARLSPEMAPGLDLVEVGYHTVENDDQNGYSLIRRQDKSLDQDISEGGTTITLTNQLETFEIVFIDQEGEAKTAWKASDVSKLPKSIKIKLVIRLDDDKTETFTTAASLPLTWPKVLEASLPPGLELPF